MLKKLLLATTNIHKIQEFNSIFVNLPYLITNPEIPKTSRKIILAFFESSNIRTENEAYKYLCNNLNTNITIFDIDKKFKYISEHR